MLSNIWEVVLYKPLVNALALLVSVIPGGDVGIAVILLTLIVKFLIFPLSQRSIESQIKMNLLAPELKKIKDSGASKEEQARQTFELYKHHKTNPFSGCLLLLIQIPVIFALYFVFSRGISLDGSLIYSFVTAPKQMSNLFLGFVDISKNHLWFLALLAGISQYFQASLMPKPVVATEKNATETFQDSLNKSMQTQMKYFFPFIIAMFAYVASGAVALYWITSNIFAIGQQMYANKKKELALKAAK